VRAVRAWMSMDRTIAMMTPGPMGSRVLRDAHCTTKIKHFRPKKDTRDNESKMAKQSVTHLSQGHGYRRLPLFCLDLPAVI
jgi:hypothetical protein